MVQAPFCEDLSTLDRMTVFVIHLTTQFYRCSLRLRDDAGVRANGKDKSDLDQKSLDSSPHPFLSWVLVASTDARAYTNWQERVNRQAEA
jgi:hypothetical protein